MQSDCSARWFGLTARFADLHPRRRSKDNVKIHMGGLAPWQFSTHEPRVCYRDSAETQLDRAIGFCSGGEIAGDPVGIGQ